MHSCWLLNLNLGVDVELVECCLALPLDFAFRQLLDLSLHVVVDKERYVVVLGVVSLRESHGIVRRRLLLLKQQLARRH